MKKKAKAAAIAAITAAAMACGMCAATPAMAKVKAPEAPDFDVWKNNDNKWLSAELSWIKTKGINEFQVRYAKKESDLKKAERKTVVPSDKEITGPAGTWQYAIISGLDPDTEYFFQMRAGKTYTAKKKIGQKAYKKAKVSGKAVTTKKVKQYKVKKASGKWSKWRKTEPFGYYESSKRYKTRTVTHYFIKSKKTVWSAWAETLSMSTAELPEANVTKNGKAQSELVVPKGSAAVSYVGLSKPWTGSDTKATVLRLDEDGELWQPADEVKGDDTGSDACEGCYDTGELCFQGWYLDEALTMPCNDATTALDAAEDSKVTLYAKWTEHNYQERRIFRWAEFGCGWIKALLPLGDIQGIKGGFANGRGNNPDNYYKLTPSLASLGKGACELVWASNWYKVVPGTLAEDHGDVALRYNIKTCTWEKVSIAKGTYYYNLYGRTNNLACWFPMKYEVCSECNHVGKRLTELPSGTLIRAGGAFEGDGTVANHVMISGNTEALYIYKKATETVTVECGEHCPYDD